MDENRIPEITLEAVPPGQNIPEWLFRSLCDGQCDNYVLLYPNEASRSQSLHRLAGLNVPIDTTHHLTLQRFISLMILDTGLPSLMQDNAGLFLAIHARTKKAAESGELPLLFSPQNQRQWTPYQTERLLSLHGALSEIKNPWVWENDPGAKEFDLILKNLVSHQF